MSTGWKDGAITLDSDIFIPVAVRYKMFDHSDWKQGGILTADEQDGILSAVDHDGNYFVMELPTFRMLQVRNIVMEYPQKYNYLCLRKEDSRLDKGILVTLKCHAPMSQNQAWDKMREAITIWVTTTEQGASSWNLSEGKLNVASLIAYDIGKNALSQILSDMDLVMEVNSLELHALREYEEVLADQEKARDAACRTCGYLYMPGGDGYDGECPNCADITAMEEDDESCTD